MNEIAQMYLRRCNDQPPEGIEIDRETVLALARAAQRYADVEIRGDLENGLSVRLPPQAWWAGEAAGTRWRIFTYMPLPSGQHRASPTA